MDSETRLVVIELQGNRNEILVVVTITGNNDACISNDYLGSGVSGESLKTIQIKDAEVFYGSPGRNRGFGTIDLIKITRHDK